jgi:hypothetical protein
MLLYCQLKIQNDWPKINDDSKKNILSENFKSHFNKLLLLIYHIKQQTSLFNRLYCCLKFYIILFI